MNHTRTSGYDISSYHLKISQASLSSFHSTHNILTDQFHLPPSMATIANFLAKPTPYLTFFPKLNPFTHNSSSYNLPNFFPNTPSLLKISKTTSTPVLYATGKGVASTPEKVERVQQVHSIAEFDEALKTAKNKLVVVEYAGSHSYHSRKIYPFMVELSRTCGDVEFLLVMGDESERTRELCEREKIDKVPHFSFYKSMEKIHEEEGIGPDELVGDVLYYGDNHSAVVQLHCR